MTAKLKNGILLIRFTDIIIGNRLEQSRAERERERAGGFSLHRQVKR